MNMQVKDGRNQLFYFLKMFYIRYHNLEISSIYVKLMYKNEQNTLKDFFALMHFIVTM